MCGSNSFSTELFLEEVTNEEVTNNERDLPPEYCHYKDEGCELADSCLSCSFPHCVYDESGGRQRWLKQWRDSEIVRLFSREGRGVKELALIFGVSPRTIQRALKRSLERARSNAQGKGVKESR